MTTRETHYIAQLEADVERLQKERVAVGVAHMETTLKLREVQARLTYVTAECKALGRRLAISTTKKKRRARRARR